jgi:hypothetical protein
MIDEGRQVAVTLKLQGGTERTINVGSTTAVTMSLQIVEGENEPDHRPDDIEFAEACRRVIRDGLLESWDIYPVNAAACSWSDDEVDDLTRRPRMDRGPLGLSPELRTPPLPATHVRAGTGHEHCPGYVIDNTADLQPTRHLTHATSCRTT